MALEPGHAYCIKCKKGVPVKNTVFARYKNNMPVEKGICSNCGCKVTRMLNKEEALKHEMLGAEGNPD